MKKDMKIRVRRVGEDIEELMSNNQVRECGVKLYGGTNRPRETKPPPPASMWIKPQPCGKNSTGTVLRRAK